MQSKEQDMATIRVSRRAAERLRAGHVWVYRADVEGGSETVLAGGLVRLVDGRGSAFGCGTYSTASTIAVRLLTPDGSLDREGFLELVGERVGAALRLRDELAPVSDVVDGRRLIFSEADRLPGIVMDQYGSMVMLQLLTQGMAQNDVRSAVCDAVLLHLSALEGSKTHVLHGSAGGGLTVWEREDGRVRELEQLPPSPAEPLLVTGDAPTTETIFRLNGLRFHYDAAAGQTGAQ